MKLTTIRRRAARSIWTPIGILAALGASLFVFRKVYGGIPLVTRIYHRERADGVLRELQSFLDWWQQSGPFPIMVGENGGARDTATQDRLYAQGRTAPGAVVTHASGTTSPHTRAAALDLWPVNAAGIPQFKVGVFSNGQWVGTADHPLDPEHLARYMEIGRLAKAHGFEWGGDWSAANKDLPHIEVRGWASLPLYYSSTRIV